MGRQTKSADPVDTDLLERSAARLRGEAERVKRALKDPRLAARRGWLKIRKSSAKRLLRLAAPVCKSAMNEAAILSDGSVTTCCIDNLGENTFGNIYDDSFETIWREGFARFRQKNLLDQEVCYSCIGCGSWLSPSITSTAEERRTWQDPELPLPKSLVLEVAGACNYACEGCFAVDLPSLRPPFLDFDRARENLAGALRAVESLRLYNYGEPLLNKDFCKILAWIREVSPTLSIGVATNGMLLNEKNIAALVDLEVGTVCVSVHGGPGTEGMLRYSKRGSDYDRVLANTAKLVDYRTRKGKETRVTLKAILFNWNDSEESMHRLREDGKRIGVDRVFWDLDGGSGLTPRGSRRFTPGSAALEALRLAGELA